MQNFKKYSVLFFLLLAISLPAQTNIKTMFYNLLNYSGDIESQNRTTYLNTILEETQPDLFLVCELLDETGSNYLLENALKATNINFAKAPFIPSIGNPNALLQMAYYNKEKLTLEKAEAIPTTLRDINHYTFKLNTADAETNPIYIEVFVTHLKASRGQSNRLRRLSSVEDFVNQLNRIPSDRHVIFAGDFNFYTSNEEGFQAIIDNLNPIKIIDPINRLCPDFPNDGRDYFDADYDRTFFWNNESFADVHSQSTRTSSLDDGSGGGMDDRFDFIMFSENFTTSSSLYYVEGSYKTIGNNANCYNGAVIDENCTGTYSQELREALYFFSDHLPIVMEMEMPENTLSTNNFSENATLLSTVVSNTLQLNLKKPVTSINIINQLGQTVILKKDVTTSNLNIDTSFLAKGLYYIKIDTFKALKFIKI